MLQQIITSGRIVDVIVAIMVIEVMVCVVWRWHSARGPSLAEISTMVLAGFFLLLALRVALTSADWRWIALFLLGSLIAHLFDLKLRWPV
jgi:hypothetical protein